MNIRFRHVLMNAEGGAPAGGAPAPAAPPAGTPPAAPAPAPTPPAIAWLAPDADSELIGHVQNKQWGSPLDAVKSHRELEKMFGADRAGRTVTLPGDDTPDAWGAVYDKLGRPPNADGYKLPVPEGADPAFAKAAASKFHELGLSAKQGEALTAWWNDQAGGMNLAQQQAQEQALQAEHQALAKDWGTGPDGAARKEMARRAAVHLGLDEGAIDAMEKVSGYSKTLKALAKVGDMLREHGAEGMNEIGSFGMTPEGAKAKRTQLMADPAWRAKAMNPQSAEWAELQKMDRILASVQQ